MIRILYHTHPKCVVESWRGDDEDKYFSQIKFLGEKIVNVEEWGWFLLGYVTDLGLRFLLVVYDVLITCLKYLIKLKGY